MDFNAFVRGQLDFAHSTLEQVIDGCDAILHDRPAGSTLQNIAACYAHAVLAEDMIVNGMVMGQTPLFMAGNWAERTGVPAKAMPNLEEAWAAQIKMNLPAFREYAKSVYARTGETVSGMSRERAEEVIDTPFGTRQPRLEFVSNLGVTHLWGHMGEIAAMKGLKGLKGLPF
jgi:hypothetical protein